MITLELGEAVHDVHGALQTVQSRLDAALLLASEATNDERIKLLSPAASKLHGMLESIERATKPSEVR